MHSSYFLYTFRNQKPSERSEDLLALKTIANSPTQTAQVGVQIPPGSPQKVACHALLLFFIHFKESEPLRA